jgi:hypothetical protein
MKESWFVSLYIRGLGLTREIIDKHCAVDRPTDHVGDLLHGHVANPAVNDQRAIEL